MKKLILMSGVPGSGKSTWANKYKEQHPNDKILIVSSDEIRKEIGGNYQYFKEEERVWNTFINRCLEFGRLNEKATVILDATNLTNYYRKMYYEKTQIFDYHVLVSFNLPVDLVFKQNKQRSLDRVVCDEVMDKMISEREEVSQEVKDLYDEYIEITSN